MTYNMDELVEVAYIAADNINDMDVSLSALIAAAVKAVVPLVASKEREACAEVLQKQVRIIYSKKVISKQNREVSHVLTMCRSAILARNVP